MTYLKISYLLLIKNPRDILKLYFQKLVTFAILSFISIIIIIMFETSQMNNLKFNQISEHSLHSKRLRAGSISGRLRYILFNH